MKNFFKAAVAILPLFVFLKMNFRNKIIQNITKYIDIIPEM